MGAPHVDLSQAEEARGCDLHIDRASLHGQGWLDIPCRGRRHRRHALWSGVSAPDLHQGRSHLFRPGHRSGAVGQAGKDHRLQRVVRDHPDAEFGIRRMGRCIARLLSQGVAGRNRPHQCACLRQRQQWRLSGRLRHHPGGLRRGLCRRVFGTRPYRTDIGAAALSGRECNHRG